MEDEKPFFTKSKETFTTDTIEAWGMLRKHYAALVDLSRRDTPHVVYSKLWHYEKKLERMIKELEKKPCLLVVSEDENRLPLDESTSSEPTKCIEKWTLDETEETVGSYLRSMQRL